MMKNGLNLTKVPMEINSIVKSEVNCYSSINIVMDKLEVDGNLSTLIDTFFSLIDGEIRFTIKGSLTRTQENQRR